MGKAKAEVRPHKRSFYVRFGKKDPERASLLESFIENGEHVKSIDAKIAKLKAEKAPFQKAKDEADDKLILGKPHDVDCSELFIHDANEVWIRRNDSKEIVDRRPMTDEEREMGSDLFETTETVTVDDD